VLGIRGAITRVKRKLIEMTALVRKSLSNTVISTKNVRGSRLQINNSRI
jgi:hypothetical protein